MVFNAIIGYFKKPKEDNVKITTHIRISDPNWVFVNKGYELFVLDMHGKR